MKNILMFGFLLYSLSFAQTKSNQIAVLNLDAVGISETESITLTDRLRSEMVNTDAFKVIERAEMDEILKEQGFQETGCTTDECAVEIGKLLNINYICAGSVGKVGALFTVSLRMIDVETGQILLNVNEDCRCPIEEVLVTSMKNIAGKLAAASKNYVSVSATGAGDVYLKSNPSAAQIFVDNEKIQDVTPATIRNISSGEHIIKVVKGDYVGSKLVNVIANEIIQETIVLGKARGSIKVYSDPMEADIFIEGKNYGRTPKIIKDLAAGDYLVILKKTGYLDVKRRVKVSGEQFAEVDGELLKPATLKITSIPTNATVIIRGQEMGKTPLTIGDLYPERVYLEVSHPGYQTDRKYIQLREAFISSEQFVLNKLPSVQVNTNPTGARVYVNSNFKGMSPVTLEELTEEKVNIEIRKTYFKDWQSELTLLPGRDEKLDVNLESLKGSIQLNSNPEGAVVLINGVRKGFTPYSTTMDYGEYNITLKLQQYESYQEQIIFDKPALSKNYDLELQKGILSLNNIPQNSKIQIDGQNVNSQASDFKMPVGKHNVKISKSGYENFNSDFVINTNNATALNVNLKRKSVPKALLRSFFIPGLGQYYQEKNTQTWLYPVLFVGSAAAAYLTINDYNKEVDNYKDIQQQYLTAFSESQIISLREKMYKTYDDVESKENLRNILLMTTGAIWLWNVLDTVILPPGYGKNVNMSAIISEENILLGLKWGG